MEAGRFPVFSCSEFTHWLAGTWTCHPDPSIFPGLDVFSSCPCLVLMWTLMGGGWPSPPWSTGSRVAGGQCSLRGWDPTPVSVMEVLGKGGRGGGAQAALLRGITLSVPLHLTP